MMEASNGSETVTIKEEPIDATSIPTDCDTTLNYEQFCSVQYAEGCDGQPQADLVDPLLKTEPLDSLVACCSNAIKEEDVQPIETDPLENTYSTKCELICAAENVEHKEPQPTPSTSAASKAEDNFEFISVGAIKQEEPEWTSDTEAPNPNPLQETVREDPAPTLQQDNDPESHRNADDSRSEGCEHGMCKKRYHHGNLVRPTTSDNTKKLYHCSVCKKQFTQMASLKSHSRIHTGEKPYHCDVCKKRFIQLSSLIVHSRIHTGQKPYQCGVCNKKFNSKSELTIHSRKHTGEKPYHCGVCKKRFSALSGLNIHTQLHTGEKPYHCRLCEKQFSVMSSLRTHTRIHTGEKPYHCGVCKKQFRVMSSLTNHSRIHTGEKPYHCDVCKKEFSALSGLTIHSRIHTGEKPYHCRVCKKQFNTLSSLTRHSRIHT